MRVIMGGRKMKKVLSFLLCMIMLTGIIAVGGNGIADTIKSLSIRASAGGVQEYTSGIYKYSYIHQLCITGVTDKTIKIINIPNIIDGKPVERIGEKAFEGCSSLKEITIPSSVTSVESNAFSDTAYYRDSSNWENGILYINDILVEAKKTISGNVSIKNGTRLIANRAFSDYSLENSCTKIQSVTLPNTLKIIGDYAFYGCSSLTNITIPDSVTSIGYYAFDGCSNLNTIKLGKSIEFIGPGAFYNTAYYKNNANWESGILYIGSCLIVTNIELPENPIIKDGTTLISCSAFSEDKIKSITIPVSIHYINEGAFTSHFLTLKDVYYKGTTAQKEKIIISTEGGGSSAYNGNNPLLHAKWHYIDDEVIYTLIYDAKGGSVTPKSINVATGGSATLPTPTRSGYTFTGWNTKSDGSGTTYKAGTSYKPTANTTLYAQWKKNPAVPESKPPAGSYVLGYDTYKFSNYGYKYGDNIKYDCAPISHLKGHCFGMAVTSSAFHTGLLSKKDILGVSDNTPLYEMSATDSLKRVICYFQSRQSPSIIKKSLVAGGTFYTTNKKKNDIQADWNETINYVKNHKYDYKGSLFFAAYIEEGTTSRHAFNFINYENVGGQDRIYIYDNESPNDLKYLYYTKGDVCIKRVVNETSDGKQYPLQNVETLALLDIYKYIGCCETVDIERILTAACNEIIVMNANVLSFPFVAGNDREEYEIFEIPSDITTIEIKSIVDNAEFEYMGEVYSFGNNSKNKTATLKLSTSSEENNAVFTVNNSDYTITYDANGGTGAPAKQTSTDNHFTLSSDIPKRVGYNFLGWGESSTAKEPKFKPGDKVILKVNNGTLYAIWEKNPLANAKLKAGQRSTTVDYRTNVTIIARAENVPDGYVIAIVDMDAKEAIARGDNKTVVYNVGEVKEPRRFAFWICKKGGDINEIGRDANGEPIIRRVDIDVKSGFFDRLFAFFLSLFKALPTKEIKPE